MIISEVALNVYCCNCLSILVVIETSNYTLLCIFFIFIKQFSTNKKIINYDNN